MATRRTSRFFSTGSNSTSHSPVRPTTIWRSTRGGEQDISTKQTYEQFRDEYHQAIKGSCALLKPGAFYAIKVSEIRDKKTGNYRNFVAETIDGFLKAGMNYYNEIILINSVGTLPLRVRRFWEPGRKVGRMHQNVLIFKKP
jgi:hypothetical protein